MGRGKGLRGGICQEIKKALMWFEEGTMKKRGDSKGSGSVSNGRGHGGGRSNTSENEGIWGGKRIGGDFSEGEGISNSRKEGSADLWK